MKKITKLLSVILCLAMFLSFALVASAEENDGAISSTDELVSGNYYIVCSNGVGLGTVDGSWILAESDSVWTVTVTENGVTLMDANGVFIAPKGGNSNGLKTNEYEWAVSCEDGLFTFAGQGDDTVVLAYNGAEAYLKFRGYKTSTANGDPATYPSTFYLYPAEAEPTPAGPVDCEIPGTLEYTFETDEAASAGVMFQWTATVDGELGVARMGENFSTMVEVNDTYGEVGDFGYIVKAGDVVAITVYGYGAGTISVPVEFVTGNEDEGEGAMGTETNPEIIAANTEYVKALESGEYFYQFTAAADGEVVINTAGDGTHNMEVFVNGDATKVYSNWDNDGAFVKLNVAAGDVLTIKVYFDFPGAGTITFTVVAEAGEVIEPVEPTIADGQYVISWGELTFGALAEDKTYGYPYAGDVNNLTDTDYITITNVGDGQFTMQDCYGRYIYMIGTYNSFNVGTEMPTEGYLWVLEEVEGGFYLKNVEKEKYIAYSEQYTSWGCYASTSETSVLALTAVNQSTPDPNPNPNPNPPTGDIFFAVLAVMVVSGLGLTAVVSKKK